ncbi:MAG: hypothetical protein RL169_2118 [Armatimonadota bacterium]
MCPQVTKSQLASGRPIGEYGNHYKPNAVKTLSNRDIQHTYRSKNANHYKQFVNRRLSLLTIVR